MKKPTSNHVAKLAGVSQATVSFVLNNNPEIIISDETRKKVIDAVEQLNYTPRSKAKNYLKPTDNLMALIIPNISNIFYPALINSVENYALAKGYKLIIVNTNRNMQNEKYYLDLLVNIKVAGIIYGFTPAFPNIAKVVSYKIPISIIGEMQEELNVDIISLNSFKAGEIVAEHLFELGHKKVAFITSPISSISLSRKRRLDGLKRFLNAKGLKDNLIALSAEDEHEFTGVNYELETGYQLTRKLIADSNVTAIIGANDMMAYGIIKALYEEKIKVPKDISVCGFDNIFLPNIIPPYLTTIDHCTDKRCRLAVDLLDDKIKGKNETPMKINYEPILIKRGSTDFAKI